MERRAQNRRRRPDVLVKWVQISGGISWSLVFTALLITIFAKPQMQTTFEYFNKIYLDKNWNLQLLRAAFVVLVLLFIFCVISLVFNALRSRRKTDRFNKSIIFNAIASFMGIILFVLFVFR